MIRDPLLADVSGAFEGLLQDPDFLATVERVERSLTGSPPHQPQAWEPLPHDVWGAILPPGIRSCWVFVLRAGARFGAERHPNSHQRTVALRGSAVFEVFQDEEWVPHPIRASGVEASSYSWISIPANTWHRIQVGPQGLTTCSFHTVPAQELVEETPVGDNLAVTHSRLYQAE